MSFRFALQEYIDNPKKLGVVDHSPGFVIIRDSYPKALRHFLVLPRDSHVTHCHPLVALRDPTLHRDISQEVEKAKNLIVDELVSEGLIEDRETGNTEFKKRFIKAGVHASPSMANLHVHVITQDFYLPLMKNKKHYNSFTTPFFIELHTLEKTTEIEDTSSDIESDDSEEELHISNTGKLVVSKKAYSIRRRTCYSEDFNTSHNYIRNLPLVCSYCQTLYGNDFLALKKHLSAEFSAKFKT